MGRARAVTSCNTRKDIGVVCEDYAEVTSDGKLKAEEEVEVLSRKTETRKAEKLKRKGRLVRLIARKNGRTFSRSAAVH
jgi:hypothetical protein